MKQNGLVCSEAELWSTLNVPMETSTGNVRTGVH